MTHDKPCRKAPYPQPLHSSSNNSKIRLWRLVGALAAAGLAGCEGSKQEEPGAPGPTEGKPAYREVAAQAEGTEGEKPAVVLEVAAVLGAPGGTFSFTLKNNKSSDFETTPIGTNYNRILITAPDGKQVEHFHWKNGIRPVVVKASQPMSWKVDLGPILESRELKGAGVYRVRWQVGELKSAEALLLKE